LYDIDRLILLSPEPSPPGEGLPAEGAHITVSARIAQTDKKKVNDRRTRSLRVKERRTATARLAAPGARAASASRTQAMRLSTRQRAMQMEEGLTVEEHFRRLTTKAREDTERDGGDAYKE